MATTPKMKTGGGANTLATRANDSALVHVRGGEPVTDSRTIAREFDRRHDNVLQTLDSLIADGTINDLDFKAVEYVDAKGEKRRMFELTERGALIAMPFVGGRNARNGQARLVDAFMVLRAVAQKSNAAPAIDLNSAASLREALLGYTGKVLALEQTVERQKPAVQFVERYVNASGSKGFRDVCKLLHAKEPEFRAFLIERDVMFRRDNRLVPYAKHIDAGRFEVKAGVTNDAYAYAFTQARFTQKGIQWIAGLWAEYRGYGNSSEAA